MRSLSLRGLHRLRDPNLLWTEQGQLGNMKSFIISVGSHSATYPSIVTAIGKLMKSVVKRGNPQEHEALARAMFEIVQLGESLDSRFDISTGIPEERN